MSLINDLFFLAGGVILSAQIAALLLVLAAKYGWTNPFNRAVQGAIDESDPFEAISQITESNFSSSIESGKCLIDDEVIEGESWSRVRVVKTGWTHEYVPEVITTAYGNTPQEAGQRALRALEAMGYVAPNEEAA